ncbi:hypothetical protein BS47DRAFT_546425 [Hydnum rufescens UP504]|uniref:ATP-dependent helicase C-terminal domain-containing protein n=1 Tax=Hydnum rufescens UP504 TaxID=1448309 RepID=A0A9P6DW91_9AGAM|nr:hypothetical protein BS47DRAFT_546425 [Hydnum rufescens UP504]
MWCSSRFEFRGRSCASSGGYRPPLRQFRLEGTSGTDAIYQRESSSIDQEWKVGGGRDAGIELYENMCMKAVNQSIGRAIRHQNDWASLILIDQRYSTPRIQSKLPQWIRGSVSIAHTWGQGLRELGAFYRLKKEHGSLSSAAIMLSSPNEIHQNSSTESDGSGYNGHYPRIWIRW